MVYMFARRPGGMPSLFWKLLIFGFLLCLKIWFTNFFNEGKIWDFFDIVRVEVHSSNMPSLFKISVFYMFTFLKIEIRFSNFFLWDFFDIVSALFQYALLTFTSSSSQCKQQTVFSGISAKYGRLLSTEKKTIYSRFCAAFQTMYIGQSSDLKGK